MTLRIFKSSTSKTLSSSQWESKASGLGYIDPMCSLFLFSSHISMHALIFLPKPRTLGFGFSYLVSYA
jgi:hypothetical protein